MKQKDKPPSVLDFGIEPKTGKKGRAWYAKQTPEELARKKRNADRARELRRLRNERYEKVPQYWKDRAKSFRKRFNNKAYLPDLADDAIEKISQQDFTPKPYQPKKRKYPGAIDVGLEPHAGSVARAWYARQTPVELERMAKRNRQKADRYRKNIKGNG